MRQLRTKQYGMVLITALLFLLVLTVLGISAITGTSLEEKMAGNLADRNMAFQAAESGLRDGAEWLGSVTAYITPSSDGSNGIWAEGTMGSTPGDASVATPAWWAANGVEYGNQTNNAPADFSANSQAPRYIIEESGFVPDDTNPETLAQRLGTYYYSISAIGWGGSATAESVLQSVYEKRFN